MLSSFLPLLPYEDECEQDDVRSKGNDPRDLQTHIASFSEEAASSLAVRFSDCRIIFRCELVRARVGLSSFSRSGDVFNQPTTALEPVPLVFHLYSMSSIYIAPLSMKR